MIWNIRGFTRRYSVTIGFIIIAIALGTILFLQALATARLQEQVDGQQQIIKQVKDIAEQLNQNSEQRTSQIDSINRHLDCIVEFFSQPDRTQKAIDNIETCQFTAPDSTTTPPLSSNSGGNSGQDTTGGGVSQNTTPVEPENTAPEAPQPSFLERLVAPINNLIKRL